MDSIVGFWMPKGGNAAGEYEDAFAIDERRVAIADGATESSFARAWAEALTDGFAADGDCVDVWSATAIETFIAPLQRIWHDTIPWNQLPWFAEEKARLGAFAAFLFFELLCEPADHSVIGDEADTVTVRWRASAAGDCCMFHVRDGTLVSAFPMERWEDFSNSPLLISSIPSSNVKVWDSIVFQDGQADPGDTFLFATDALACWLLREHEENRNPWVDVAAVSCQTEFEKLISHLRESSSLRNDDVTFVRLLIGEGNSE